MSWYRGFNFRQTSGYVTDAADDTYMLKSDAYPTVRNGITFGWVSTANVDDRDRNSTLDPRIAGVSFRTTNGTSVFKIDLPSAGKYLLRLAIGDPASITPAPRWRLLDDTALLADNTFANAAAGSYRDAAGNVFTAANWPGSNVGVEFTFASLVCNFEMWRAVNSICNLSHLSLQLIAAAANRLGPTPINPPIHGRLVR